MAVRQTRLKVERGALIAKLKLERDKAQSKYSAEKKTLDSRKAEAAERLAHEVSGFCDLLLNSPARALKRVDTDYRGGIRVHFKTTIPPEPSKPSAKIDRLIRTLEAASDDYVLVSADDDFAAWL